ncbi:EF-hand and coiled-coil domain-containing protein 1-like [Petromyzon marinus]|uniref:EF-hand and coiled-coil domain-containing protein 1-like n=1 Tax=Petromyzon marinus TaxID=7757 RepID=UPI003F70B6A9
MSNRDTTGDLSSGPTRRPPRALAEDVTGGLTREPRGEVAGGLTREPRGEVAGGLTREPRGEVAGGLTREPRGEVAGGLAREPRGEVAGGLARDPARDLAGALRPAPRTHWVVSALAAHFGHDRGAENEIAVLATGLDQYLQEVFHHLDYPGLGTLPADDFRALCDVLGLTDERARGGDGGDDDDQSDYDDGGGGGGGCGGSSSIRLLKDLPQRLTFRQFHARLCDHFSCAQRPPGPGERMPVGEENELIEAQIRVRDPVRRRRRVATTTRMMMSRNTCSSSSSNSSSGSSGGSGGGGNGGCAASPPRGDGETDGGSTEGSDEWTHLVEDENASLRELVEDLRVALQSSDARCLALNVALRKRRRQEPSGSTPGPHPGSHLDPHLGPHLGPHLDSHLDTRVGSHLGPHLDPHLGPHLDPHLGPHLDPHLGPHLDPHLGGPHLDSHLDTRVDSHLVPHLGTQLDPHMDPHRDPHLDPRLQVALRHAVHRERALVHAQVETARRVREARRLLAKGLARVLQLEALWSRHQAHRVQRSWAAERDRSFSCASLPSPRRRSPTGGAASPTSQGEERLLLRAVEGQEAPGEAVDAWRCGPRAEAGFPLPGKRPTLPPDCCPYGCRKGLVKRLVRTFSDPEGSREKGAGRTWEKIAAGSWEASPARGPESFPGDWWKKGGPKGSPAGGSEMVELMRRVQRLSAQLQEEQEVRRRKGDAQQWREGLVAELRARREEGRRLQTELQVLEAERVRLSLVEEKMGDVLHAMRRLGTLNASRHLLGKILLDTLESCRDVGGRDDAAGPEDVSAVLDALRERLSACDPLGAVHLEPLGPGQRRTSTTAAAAAAGSSSSSPAPSSSSSSLLLSC